MVHPLPPMSLPPLTADFENVIQPATPGVPAQKTPWSLARASDGTTRTNQGNTSVISYPAHGQSLLLDHLKKEAMIIPAQPPAPPKPQLAQLGPNAQHLLAPPPAPQIQDLGKRFMGTHEVEGKLFTFQRLVPTPHLPPTPTAPTPTAPKAPEVKLPGAPKLPELKVPKLDLKAPKLPDLKAEMPKAPMAPKAPEPPKPPAPPPMPPPSPIMQQVETWTHTKLKLPMFTRARSPKLEVTQVCKQITPGEPHPALFKIPPGYKLVEPPKPQTPNLQPPKVELPKAPALPR